VLLSAKKEPKSPSGVIKDTLELIFIPVLTLTKFLWPDSTAEWRKVEIWYAVDVIMQKMNKNTL